MKNKFTSSVLHEGYIYGLDEAILACIDAATGELKWKGGRYGYGQILLAGDHVIVLTEDGDLVLVRATPERHDEVARFPAIEGKTWNHPIIAGGYLLVRNLREMAAFDCGLSPIGLLAALENPEVHARDRVHVASHGGVAIRGCRRDVLEGARLVAERFEVQAQVQVGEEERFRLIARGRQNSLGPDRCRATGRRSGSWARADRDRPATTLPSPLRRFRSGRRTGNATRRFPRHWG